MSSFIIYIVTRGPHRSNRASPSLHQPSHSTVLVAGTPQQTKTRTTHTNSHTSSSCLWFFSASRCRSVSAAARKSFHEWISIRCIVYFVVPLNANHICTSRSNKQPSHLKNWHSTSLGKATNVSVWRCCWGVGRSAWTAISGFLFYFSILGFLYDMKVAVNHTQDTIL